jgi:serine/threonine protein phosphatase PrpC
LGLLKREEAATYKQRNVITRAVGVESPLYLDSTTFTAQLGDLFILCSDGLYNVINDEEIIEIVALRDVNKIADELIAQAIQKGAPDNVSVVIVQGGAGRISVAESAKE